MFRLPLAVPRVLHPALSPAFHRAWPRAAMRALDIDAGPAGQGAPAAAAATASAASPGPLLRVEGVSRGWESGSVQALDDVRFVASAGETIALTGPSGCGKSTLLSLIGLLDQPDAGQIVLAGQDLRRVRQPAAFRARQLGFVFQFHHMVPTMTLLENVMAPMLATQVPRVERQARAMAMLARMDLDRRAGFLPNRVSGGERQRAAVARALVNRPPVVLADEPTGNLDSRNGHTVVQLLLDHAREAGALVLIATHNPEIAAACSRRLALRDGRLVADSAHDAAAAPAHASIKDNL